MGVPAVSSLVEGSSGSVASYSVSLSGTPTAEVRVELINDGQLEIFDDVT